MKKLFLILSVIAVLFVAACSQVQPDTPTDDVDCGNLPEAERDACCAEQNSDTPHIMCVGGWQYTEQGCSWVCETPEEPGDNMNNTEESSFNIRYDEGVLYYNITVDKPTPCNQINLTENVMESFPPQVAVNMKMLGYDGFCTQVITPEVVQGSVETGSKPSSITFYLNGEAISAAQID